MADRLLDQARRLWAAWPDSDALWAVDIGTPPAGDPGPAATALRYLRDEMLLVQAGTAGGVGVLADEIAHAEAVLAGQ
jgi:hypothetical protein